LVANLYAAEPETLTSPPFQHLTKVKANPVSWGGDRKRRRRKTQNLRTNADGRSMGLKVGGAHEGEEEKKVEEAEGKGKGKKEQ